MELIFLLVIIIADCIECKILSSYLCFQKTWTREMGTQM